MMTVIIFNDFWWLIQKIKFLSLIIIWSLSDEARIGTGMHPWSITSPVWSWKSSRNNNFQENEEEKSIFTSEEKKIAQLWDWKNI